MWVQGGPGGGRDPVKKRSRIFCLRGYLEFALECTESFSQDTPDWNRVFRGLEMALAITELIKREGG
jgi:hypothetical protein